MAYLRELSDQPAGACFLCDAWTHTQQDQALLVLHRNDQAMILMNRFPYSTGHLMVVPGQHAGDLPDLSAADRTALMEMTVVAERLIHVALNPQGLNIGLNIGRAAGAGLPGHLHIHIVPRWGGDTNFINIIGQVRVIPQALDQTYRELAAALDQVLEGIG